MRLRTASIAPAALTASLLTGTLLAGCGGGGDDAGSNSLKIGYIAGSAASLPDIIARDRGMFEDAGLDVEFVSTDSGPGLVNLALSGSVDVTWAPTSNVLNATEKLQIVAGNVRSYGFELVRRVGFEDGAADLDYPANLQALADARIGVSATASYAEVVAGQMFADAGVGADDVEFLSVGVGPTSQGALKSAQVDLLLANPVTAAQLEVDGAGDAVVSTSEIPALQDLPEAVYVTRRGISDASSESVAKYLGIVDAAIEWGQSTENADEFAALMTESYGLDPSDAPAVTARFSPAEGALIDEYGLDLDEAGFDALVAMLVDGGLLDAEIAYADAVNLIEPEE